MKPQDPAIELMVKRLKVLTGPQGEQEVPHRGGQARGTEAEEGLGHATLRFTFDQRRGLLPGDGPAVLQRFVGLLQGSSAYHVLVVHHKAERSTVAVRFRYHSEIEHARHKEHVLWLLELSRRACAGNPFGGA